VTENLKNFTKKFRNKQGLNKTRCVFKKTSGGETQKQDTSSSTREATTTTTTKPVSPKQVGVG
jgi:hypothetical protein